MPFPDLALPPGITKDALEPHLKGEDAPGSSPYYSMTLAGLQLTAERLGISLREAMLLFLEQDLWPLRFKQNRGVFSARDQAALLHSRAVILGCGGLGGHCLTLLARLGAGEFTLCDYDSFDESNLNRQLLCGEDALGMNKAEAGGRELRRIASHAEATIITEAATEQSLPGILKRADVVVDCLDDPATRLVAEHAAKKAGIPFVYGTIAGMEGFALLSPAQLESALDRLYPTPDGPKQARAEYGKGVPTLTPAVTAVLQCLLVVRSLTGASIPAKDGLELLHVDLSVPEIETLWL